MITPEEISRGSQAQHYKVVRVPYHARKQIIFRLVDDENTPVNLYEEPPAPDGVDSKPNNGYEPEVAQGTTTVHFYVRQELGCQLEIHLEGKIVQPADAREMGCADEYGLVQFDWRSERQLMPGIYLAEIQRQVDGGYIVDTFPCYLMIEPSLHEQLNYSSTITVPEIRLALGDSQIGETSLLDALEYDDTEIVYCIRRVVDEWNETPPNVNRYSTQNFPFRHWWIQGTMVQLLRIAAMKYRRDQLAYSAAGLTIDDQNKSQEYEATAAQIEQRYREWFLREKRRQNIQRGWSTIGYY